MNKLMMSGVLVLWIHMESWLDLPYYHYRMVIYQKMKLWSTDLCFAYDDSNNKTFSDEYSQKHNLFYKKNKSDYLI